MEKDAFKFTGAGAVSYDRYLGPFLFEPYAVKLASSIKHPETIASVLEIACGTGRVTKHLGERFVPPVKLVASDFSADMLQVAKTKLNNEAIEFFVEDAQSLSFADNSFDLVVCQFGLMFLQDKRKGLSEAYRVLKPGGRFMAFTWDKTENMPLLKLLFNDNILPAFKKNDGNRLLVPFSLHNPVLLAGWMLEINFTHIETSHVVLQSGAADPGHIVNAFFRKHSIGQEVLAADPQKFEAMATKMQNDISAQFADATTFQLSAFLITGQKEMPEVV